MANKYILDTHALVWFLEGNSRLGQQAKMTINTATDEMVLPLIGLVGHRRLTMMPPIILVRLPDNHRQ